ncbi:MAG: GDSL-type esterase/lipase family protein, partial [Melioribacter sp.]
KTDSTYRIFVLGGSSAAGYPYMPMGSYSRYLRRRLELNYPHKEIEVINLSLTAVNSYTIKDFIGEVVKQQPDLILIYAGHNEYYGALGVGSLESFGSTTFSADILIFLNKFKTTQLIRDIIKQVSKLIFNKKAINSGTLMSQMAKEKVIPFNSEKYKEGLRQFSNNLEKIIRQTKSNNIPLIVSTVASNLKDQPPFISTEANGLPRADSIFTLAVERARYSNFKSADSLFRYAKDLDALRFRAPEELNGIIIDLAKKYNVSYIDSDSLLASSSPMKIIGDNLMTDHLHPTLEGQQLIGKLFYERIAHLKLLPEGTPKYPLEIQDSITRANFFFSELDSTIAVYRIKILKNDWPYNKTNKKLSYKELLKPHTFIDSVAYKVVANKLTWAEAQDLTARHFLNAGDVKKFVNHIGSLIYEYPYIKSNYILLETIAVDFLKQNKFREALEILTLHYSLKPDAFSTKWIGQIMLSDGNIKESIKYLEESHSYNPNDQQVMYNLAGAYALNQEYNKAKELTEQLIRINPTYPGIQNLYSQLLLNTR